VIARISFSDQSQELLAIQFSDLVPRKRRAGDNSEPGCMSGHAAQQLHAKLGHTLDVGLDSNVERLDAGASSVLRDERGDVANLRHARDSRSKISGIDKDTVHAEHIRRASANKPDVFFCASRTEHDIAGPPHPQFRTIASQVAKYWRVGCDYQLAGTAGWWPSDSDARDWTSNAALSCHDSTSLR
jgi:hypothetical protein